MSFAKRAKELHTLCGAASARTPLFPKRFAGCWTRDWIRCPADGDRDASERTVWLQSPFGYYGDVRFPPNKPREVGQLTSFLPRGSLSENAALWCAKQLGDAGICKVDMSARMKGEDGVEKTTPQAMWHASLNFQPNVQYPEPGFLVEESENVMLEVPPSNEYIERWSRTSIDASKFNEDDADARTMARTHAYLELVEEKFPSYEDWDKDNVRPTLADKGCMIVSGGNLFLARDNSNRVPTSRRNSYSNLTECINDGKSLSAESDGADPSSSSDSAAVSSRRLLDAEFSFASMSKRPSAASVNNSSSSSKSSHENSDESSSHTAATPHSSPSNAQTSSSSPRRPVSFEIQHSTLPFREGRQLLFLDNNFHHRWEIFKRSSTEARAQFSGFNFDTESSGDGDGDGALVLAREHVSVHGWRVERVWWVKHFLLSDE